MRGNISVEKVKQFLCVIVEENLIFILCCNNYICQHWELFVAWRSYGFLLSTTIEQAGRKRHLLEHEIHHQRVFETAQWLHEFFQWGLQSGEFARAFTSKARRPVDARDYWRESSEGKPVKKVQEQRTVDEFVRIVRQVSFSVHICSCFDEFLYLNSVMAMFTEKIKKDAIDSFDNFIIQAVLPGDEEIKGIVEHNRLVQTGIIKEQHRNSFLFSNAVESFMSSANHSSAFRTIIWFCHTNWCRRSWFAATALLPLAFYTRHAASLDQCQSQTFGRRHATTTSSSRLGWISASTISFVRGAEWILLRTSPKLARSKFKIEVFIRRLRCQQHLTKVGRDL